MPGLIVPSDSEGESPGRANGNGNGNGVGNSSISPSSATDSDVSYHEDYSLATTGSRVLEEALQAREDGIPVPGLDGTDAQLIRTRRNTLAALETQRIDQGQGGIGGLNNGTRADQDMVNRNRPGEGSVGRDSVHHQGGSAHGVPIRGEESDFDEARFNSNDRSRGEFTVLPCRACGNPLQPSRGSSSSRSEGPPPTPPDCPDNLQAMYLRKVIREQEERLHYQEQALIHQKQEADQVEHLLQRICIRICNGLTVAHRHHFFVVHRTLRDTSASNLSVIREGIITTLLGLLHNYLLASPPQYTIHDMRHCWSSDIEQHLHRDTRDWIQSHGRVLAEDWIGVQEFRFGNQIKSARRR